MVYVNKKEFYGIYRSDDSLITVGTITDILPFAEITKQSLVSTICKTRKGQATGKFRNGTKIVIFKEDQ